jgi:hypothetical protein
MKQFPKQDGEKKMEIVDPELRVEMLLQAEKEERLPPGKLEELLDSKKYKEDLPEIRQALLKELKRLGRVPQDKE